ncbi:MAG TPA: PAS domain S-box protein [Bacillus bacterium]|nr:PAS domain S-box protein [Bacillus sp. (in: firmicutes)]
MLKDLLLNVTIIISFLFLIGILSRRFIRSETDYTYLFNSFKTKLMAGVVFGFLGVFLMFFSIKVSTLVIIDLRHIATVIGATYFGAPAAILSSLIVGIARLFFGGLNNASFVVLGFMVLIGIVCSLTMKMRASEFRKFFLMNMVSTFLITVTVYINLSVFSDGKDVVKHIIAYYWFFSIIGGFLTYYVAKYIFDSNKLFAELIKSNSNLEEANSKFQSLINHLQSSIIVEDEQRRVTLANDSFHDLFHFPKSKSIVNEDVVQLELIAKEQFVDGEAYFNRKKEILAQNELIIGEQYHLVDGRVLERDFIPIKSAQGIVSSKIWHYRDITKNKEYEINIKKSEENYKALSEKYQLVVDTVKEVIFTTDSKGNWTFLNKAWKEITGFSIEKSIGKNFLDFIHPDDQERNNQLFQCLLDRDSLYCRNEIRYKTKDGSYRWIEMYAKLMLSKDDITIGTSGSLSDITLRKEMEIQLFESEQLYKSLFDYNHSATFTLDLTGHFNNVNKSVEQVTGYSKKDLMGSSFIPLISKSYVAKTIEQFNRVIGGESITFETKVIQKNGGSAYLQMNAAPIIINGKPEGAIAVAHDITRQKEAEYKLLESEMRYRRLIDLSPEVIFVHSKTKIEFVNDRALTFIGAKSKDEIIGKSVFEFLHPDDRQIAAYNMKLGFKVGTSFPGLDGLRFVRLDGTIVITNVGAKLIDYNGKPAMLGIIHDITERKETELRLKEANDKLMLISQIDGLTDIPNRRYYEEIFDKEWKDAVRNVKPISLIMLDIDNFKNYNDTYGHLVGDACLKRVSNALKSCLNRPRDFVARYGGEEFSVILPDTDEQGAVYVGETLRAKIEELSIPHENSNVKSIVTISVGVATIIPDRESKYESLIKIADDALYKAKQTGRNRVCSLQHI